VKDSTLQTIKKADLKREAGKKGSAEVLEAGELGNRVDVESTDSSGNKECCSFTLKDEEEIQLGNMLSPIHQRLQVGQKILLAVVWIREDERRLFELFPEVFMIDITWQTNNEGRPLAVSASFDSQLKTFTPLRAFLPSECQWVFLWLWTTAIPTLLGKENISRTQLVLTDGDINMYNPFNTVKAALYPSAIHGLCIYHLVTQPMGKLDIVRKDISEVQRMVKT